MDFIKIVGHNFKKHLTAVADLRMKVFSEYPYLYEGNKDDEKKYLENFSRSKNSLLILAKEKNEFVGAITGMPLVEMEEIFVSPFLKNHLPIHLFYYLGELLLLKEFRGQGLEKKIYDEFEEWFKQKNEWSKIAVAEIKREQNDPKRPQDYVDIISFWKNLGFVEQPNVSIELPYKEIGNKESTQHLLTFLFKEF